MQVFELSASRPLVTIALAFIAWKALLALIVWGSPGIGYDTSSSLLEDFPGSIALTNTPSTLQHLLTKFVRWDAIYFTQIAARQYVFEQEWAFSFAFSKVVSILSLRLLDSFDLNLFQSITLSGVGISHIAHLSSAYVVYILTKGVYVKPSASGGRVALGAALLHIISPAGVFLSAPYTEGLFSLLNISGFALYMRGMTRTHGHATVIQRLQLVFAGFVFGVATTMRSNGLLSGLPFLYDAFARTWAVINHGFSSRRLYDLTSLIIGGLLVACGLVMPQAFAYRMYCVDISDVTRQPWCSKAIPSIYGWVQEHYWDVGLLRYWTVSNIPLFLLAAPMLWVLSYSSFRALWPDNTSKQVNSSTKAASSMADKPDEGALVRLALPQLVLAILALLIYNIQIITRLSSGYPLWYIWLAERVVNSTGFGQEDKSPLRSKYIVRFMVLYALIQAGLFASFLPPA